MNIYVPGKGNPNARILLLGEAPFYEEEKYLTPFVGPSGNILNKLLIEAGINRDECWVTNVSKYMIAPQVREGKQKSFQARALEAGINLDKQLDELRSEITQIQPNVIVPFGGSALWAMTGRTEIDKFRGSILDGWGFKTIPTWHPASLIHQAKQDGGGGYWKSKVMLFDLRRAKAQSLFKERILPSRLLTICRGSDDLKNFIRRWKNHSYPAIDIEAYTTGLPACIGISFDPSEGFTVPLWNHNGISNIPTMDMVNVWIDLADFLAQQEVVGQNFGYDRDKIRRIGLIIKKLYSDTLLKGFAINPELPHNLAFYTSIYTEEPYYKDEGMYEGEIHDLFIGCAKDACVTKEVDIAQEREIESMGLGTFYRKFLLPLHSVYFYNEKLDAIEQNGFRIDEEVRRELIRKYTQWHEELQYKLFKLTGENVNVYAYEKVAELLYEKLGIPVRAGTGEEVLAQLLANTVKNPLHREVIDTILEDRRVRKTLSGPVMAPPDFDGRMRTSYYICLKTGRSSTQQQEPPIRPWIYYRDAKGLKKKVARGVAFQTITKHGDIGADVRTAFIPDPGCLFLQADSAQAEARVIFLLAEDYQALEDIDTHDYHALTASWFFGGTESDYSKKVLGYESPIRFAGKTLRHAGHLGASKRRAAIEINTQARKYKIAYTISEAEAERALKIFHLKQPKIRGVFHAEIIKCLERNRRLVSPVPFGIDTDVAGIRIFFERWGDELFREAFSYIPQRTVSENTKGAALRIRGSEEFGIEGRATWIKILVESHDALLVQVPIERKNEAAQILKEELERPIDFTHCSLSREKLVIPCDIEEGYNYKDLSKFKWLMEE